MSKQGVRSIVVVTIAVAFGMLLLGAAWACEGSGCKRKLAQAPHSHTTSQATPAQVVHITVDSGGFKPARVELKSGKSARLVFHRTSAPTCANEVQIPALGIAAKPLRVGQDTVIDVTPTKPGHYSFGCKMNMVKGELVVR